MKKNICIITGTRAEYGLFCPLIKKINEDEKLNLQLVVTGMHLSPEFGLTYKQIEEDGYKIDEKVEILLSSDTSIGISKSMGLAIISFSEVFDRLKPDMIVVLGDRYEIFSVVSVANISRIPVCHLCGGEVTEGVVDEFIRHSITKMSYLHFTSAEKYRKRVIQLGESPDRVFNFGDIGIENIKKMNLLSKEELEESINFKLDKKYAIVTFHPVTLENNTSKNQFRELLLALDKIKDLKVIFTKANSDTDGRIINKMIDEFVLTDKERFISFTSMGSLRYLSAIKYSDVVIGNSSSGIVEVPSFNKPTINIGDRQKGRIQAKSIINCKPVKNDIEKAIERALSDEFLENIKDVKNPYGDGNVSDKVIEKIKYFLENDKINLKKKFYDLEF